MFTTNNLSGYLDFNLMNAEIEAFEGNGVVIRIDLLDAEKKRASALTDVYGKGRLQEGLFLMRSVWCIRPQDDARTGAFRDQNESMLK